MKPQDSKVEFIKLRAEGKSYSVIAETLHISKSTCTSWERELKEQIGQLKQDQLNELYESYYMTKDARIRKLGDTLNSINAALETADLASLPPEKLLDFKLKYTDALKSEYTGTVPTYQLGEAFGPKDIMSALADLINRIQAGEVSTDQASKESMILTNLLKTYDAVELKKKLDALSVILGARA